jgi:hypothetical protein
MRVWRLYEGMIDDMEGSGEVFGHGGNANQIFDEPHGQFRRHFDVEGSSPEKEFKFGFR